MLQLKLKSGSEQKIAEFKIKKSFHVENKRLCDHCLDENSSVVGDANYQTETPGSNPLISNCC